LWGTVVVGCGLIGSCGLLCGLWLSVGGWLSAVSAAALWLSATVAGCLCGCQFGGCWLFVAVSVDGYGWARWSSVDCGCDCSCGGVGGCSLSAGGSVSCLGAASVETGGWCRYLRLSAAHSATNGKNARLKPSTSSWNFAKLCNFRRFGDKSPAWVTLSPNVAGLFGELCNFGRKTKLLLTKSAGCLNP
jgi:hypothetical protein